MRSRRCDAILELIDRVLMEHSEIYVSPGQSGEDPTTRALTGDGCADLRPTPSAAPTYGRTIGAAA